MLFAKDVVTFDPMMCKKNYPKFIKCGRNLRYKKGLSEKDVTTTKIFAKCSENCWPSLFSYCDHPRYPFPYTAYIMMKRVKPNASQLGKRGCIVTRVVRIKDLFVENSQSLQMQIFINVEYIFLKVKGEHGMKCIYQ